MVECFCISNWVNTEVSKLTKYQRHGGYNSSLSAKIAKIEKQKAVSFIKLF